MRLQENKAEELALSANALRCLHDDCSVEEVSELLSQLYAESIEISQRQAHLLLLAGKLQAFNSSPEVNKPAIQQLIEGVTRPFRRILAAADFPISSEEDPWDKLDIRDQLAATAQQEHARSGHGMEGTLGATSDQSGADVFSDFDLVHEDPWGDEDVSEYLYSSLPATQQEEPEYEV